MARPGVTKHSRESSNKKNKQTTTNFIENWKITNYITFPPANSYELIEAGGADDILQNKIYI